MQFRDASNTLRTAATISFRDAGNVLRTLAGLSFRDAGNVLRTTTSGLISASALPTTVYGYGSSGGSIYITTDTTTATVTGGTPPYTHSWIPADLSWSAINPGSASTPFRSPVLGTGENSGTTFTDTITDLHGRTTTVTVDAYAENLGYSY
jgi:hypothetical protein